MPFLAPFRCAAGHLRDVMLTARDAAPDADDATCSCGATLVRVPALEAFAAGQRDYTTRAMSADAGKPATPARAAVAATPTWTGRGGPAIIVPVTHGDLADAFARVPEWRARTGKRRADRAAIARRTLDGGYHVLPDSLARDATRARRQS